MTEADHRRSQRTILLVNADKVHSARNIKENLPQAKWKWVETPPDGHPKRDISSEFASLDAVIDFTETYQEQVTLALCEAMRQQELFAQILLLVAINMYQMPPGNSVSRLPNASFIFNPLTEDSLLKRLGEMSGQREE